MYDDVKAFLTLYINKIKQYSAYIQGGLLLILTGAFLFEKMKKDEAEASVAEEKTLAEVKVDQAQIASNDSQIAQQEKDRQAIQKGAEDAKSDDGDPTSFLAKR